MPVWRVYPGRCLTRNGCRCIVWRVPCGRRGPGEDTGLPAWSVLVDGTRSSLNILIVADSYIFASLLVEPFVLIPSFDGVAGNGQSFHRACCNYSSAQEIK